MISADQSNAYLKLITPKRVKLLGATTIEEQAFCEWYTSNYFRGEGCIVELGPWLGSITVSTAVGLLRNLPANTPSIHVFDLFRWEIDSSLWARKTPFENIYRKGDDFLPLYKEIIAPFKSHIDINVYSADLSQETWDSNPIECLINDAWKTVPVMVNTICQFFPSLIPGATLLHQDYLWCTDSFIHIGMYRLRDYFDIVHRIQNSQMVVFRLNKAIPSNISEYFTDLGSVEDFEVEEIEAAFEWSASLFGDNHPDAALVIRAAKAWMLYKVGYIDEARGLFLQNRESLNYSHPFYFHQEDTLRSWGLGKLFQHGCEVDTWYSESMDLGNNWRWNDWFGYFNINNDPWFYHSEHGWLYIFPSVKDTGSIYLWDNAMMSVLWSSEAIYPTMYRFSDNKWISYC